MIPTIIGFLAALPDLIKLFQIMDQRIRESNLDTKVKDDLKTLHDAFDAKDQTKINALFNTPDNPHTD